MSEQNSLVPRDHEMVVYDTMAKQAVQSKFYRNFGDTSAIMTIMLSARELGISPMAALNGGLNIIQGKVEISARMMNALIRRAGHSIVTVKCTETECELKGKRADNGDQESASFTMEDAKKASLIKPGGGWQKYPADMLYARALSRLARRLFPDVIGCAYVEGEIVDARAEIVEPQGVDLDCKQSDKMDAFIAKFDKDDAMHMQEYIKQVQEKYGLSYDEIIDKYDLDVKGFMEKFDKWKAQQLKN